MDERGGDGVGRRSVNTDDAIREWKLLNASWSRMTEQSRLKREREEKAERQAQQAQQAQQRADHSQGAGMRLGGQPFLQRIANDASGAGPGGRNLRLSSAIEISEPPSLFTPTSIGMLFNLLMGSDTSGNGGGGGGGGGGGARFGSGMHVGDHSPSMMRTEVIRSPSGESSRVIMMSSSTAPEAPRRAGMIFNDRRLDAAGASASAAAAVTGASGPPSHSVFGAAAAPSRRDLFRTRLEPFDTSAATSRFMAAASGADAVLQAVLNRSFNEHQPQSANLRNGGSTLIPLESPPPVSDVENCPICLDGDRDQPWAMCPSCRNPSHLACAKQWLTQRATCCICRAHIP
jgi:hypothetical protein